MSNLEVRLAKKNFYFLVRSRPEAGAGFGIEKSGRGSRAPNQIQKFIFPPELSPNFWLPVTAYEAVEAVEVGLRVTMDVEDGARGVVAVLCEDGGRLRRVRGLKTIVNGQKLPV